MRLSSLETISSLKMAEHVVSRAIERLYELLRHDPALPFSVGVRDDVIALGDKLKQIHNRLVSESFWARVQEDDSWLKLVTDHAYEVCDVVDCYIFKLKGFRTRKSRLRAQIKSISENMETICKKINTTDVKVAKNARTGQKRSLPAEMDDHSDEIVGMDQKAVDELKRLLVKEKGKLSSVCIVGKGGIGKSTLARQLFGDSELVAHFNYRAWVYMSRNYSPRDVLYEILVKVGFRGELKREKKETYGVHRGEISEGAKKERYVLKDWGEDEFIKCIKSELKDKRYLVVVDGICDRNTWNLVQAALPDGDKGSMIMFTTRSTQLSQQLGGSQIDVNPLSDAHSTELLALKAFRKQESCLFKFGKLLKDMAKLCLGIPLLINVLGELLRTNSSLDEWTKLRDRLTPITGHEIANKDFIIMLFGYNGLPCHLTPCLLYFASFQDNTEIPKQKLIRLWVAEGFIPSPRRDEETIEDIAEGYLQELVDRCMVQIVTRDHTGVGIKSCRVHDLIKDLCDKLAEKSNFFNRPYSTSSILGRRVVVHNSPNGCGIQADHPGMTSLIWLATTNPIPILNSWSKKSFMLLRLLELGFFNIPYSKEPTKLPKEIGNLVNLRYLGLRDVLICKLPSSIGNLRYLQTLDLRGNDLQSLPKTISKLTCLRHLLLPSIQSYTQSNPNWNRSLFRMDKMKNLHTLKFIEAIALIRYDAVVRLTNVRKLKVEFRSSQEVKAVLASPIVQQNRLRSLHMFLLSNESFPSLESLSECQNLRKLGLHGSLNEEDLQCLPATLQQLLLSKSEMNHDSMKILEKMKHLKFLRLGQNSYNAAEMVCLADGFPKLETLQLVELSKLTQWRVESGSMPKLVTLDVENTHIKLPEQVKSLPSLKFLNITQLWEAGQVPTETSQDKSKDKTVSQEKHMGRSTSFELNLNMPPTVSVNLISAQITSAAG